MFCGDGFSSLCNRKNQRIGLGCIKSKHIERDAQEPENGACAFFSLHKDISKLEIAKRTIELIKKKNICYNVHNLKK